MDDPLRTNAVNVDGFINMLVAAKDAGVKRFVYASSSAVYGDTADSPQIENSLGRPLSPYAASKTTNETYAVAFQMSYGLQAVGLRYFNVFGRRQDPAGAYAAVIPRWIASLLRGERCRIFGDGETTRDFCYIANVLQANLLAATVDNMSATCQAYNVACADSVSLNDLFRMMRDRLALNDRRFRYKQQLVDQQQQAEQATDDEQPADPRAKVFWRLDDARVRRIPPICVARLGVARHLSGQQPQSGPQRRPVCRNHAQGRGI